MKQKIFSIFMVITMLLCMGATVTAEEYAAPYDLQWVENDPGTIRFKPVAYTDQYSVFFYKNNEFVYHTYCYYYGEDEYLVADYARFSLAELGDGSYTYKVQAVRQETFETLAESEMSNPLIYKKPPELSELTNVKFEGNTISWTDHDSRTDRYLIKLMHTYDGLDYYDIQQYEVYEDYYTLDESDWDFYYRTIDLWHDIDATKYDKNYARLAVQIYSIPKDRTQCELVATDCIFLTDSVLKKENTTSQKEITLTVGSTDAMVNGFKTSTDAPPQIVNNRTMLPIRIIAETFGANVLWKPDTRTVEITRNDIEILITIDSATAVVNGKEIGLEVPAFIENQRTYLPVRFVSENLGAEVLWNPDTRTVTIHEKE